MISLPSCSHAAAMSQPARAFLSGATVLGGSMGHAKAFAREFAGWRGAAYFREGGRADRGEGQKPTDRGPDKRPQCAALSVGCFCLCFWLIRQCAAPTRNVRHGVNALLILGFPHIAGAGHG
ncbi:hypothetical protein PY365_11345 [Roseiarcaceae bacterium H3SJ34-1]|uniref:hypothetical protein n=1 Tax=Terripilifer ovatus TaxID=3032367 RepID=UPI003AB99322|nr:hypothetical protein [Roseiarcaceae bacterium H3SJ34-1]